MADPSTFTAEQCLGMADYHLDRSKRLLAKAQNDFFGPLARQQFAKWAQTSLDYAEHFFAVYETLEYVNRRKREREHG